MSIRPSTGWPPIHPNYVAGIAACTVPFVFYPVWERTRSQRGFPVLYTFLISLGLAVAAFAVVMATSRGVILALGSGLGALVLWKVMNLNTSWHRPNTGSTYSVVLLLFLAAVITILYLGPAQFAGDVIGTSYYGNGSRAELFWRSLYLVADAPLTGGGLGSFPGLYSRYLLSIPFFYLPNSHNLFLDVAIEQGIAGGLAFLFLYLLSFRGAAARIAETNSMFVFNRIALFSLVVAAIHGMVDNYLYNGSGSLLALLPVGLSVSAGETDSASAPIGLTPITAGAMAVLLAIGIIFLNPLRSTWLANLGSVNLAKSELAGFPLSVWTEISKAPDLTAAEIPLRSALRLDPTNRTANHRLGLVAMTRGDFEAAAKYLEAALTQAPGHRGIVKSLGFCYAWLGEWDKAQPLLEKIPESRSELEVYKWWWVTQGRKDLSDHATQMVSRLKKEANQP
jgi:O-antigen ligase